MYRGATTSFYQADGLGSVTSLSDGSGTVAASYVYDSFGNLASSTGTLTNSFRNTARELDSETGLYYYRARYYDPALGRFLSEDPIGFQGGLNLYGYVKNEPVDLSDPLGLFTIDDRITVNRTLGINAVCPETAGGACTVGLAARVLCTCECNGSGWKAKAILRIYGRMHIYSGIWALLPLKPKDKSVVDAASAMAHERTVHINPAIAAVTPTVNELEAKTFKTKEECRSACDATSDAASKLFDGTLRKTQEQENRQ